MPKEYKLCVDSQKKERRKKKRQAQSFCKAIIIIMNDPFMYVWCAT
jgi:hypothetical protein